jgi:hypothetical protein
MELCSKTKNTKTPQEKYDVFWVSATFRKGGTPTHAAQEARDALHGERARRDVMCSTVVPDPFQQLLTSGVYCMCVAQHLERGLRLAQCSR